MIAFCSGSPRGKTAFPIWETEDSLRNGKNTPISWLGTLTLSAIQVSSRLFLSRAHFVSKDSEGGNKGLGAAPSTAMRDRSADETYSPRSGTLPPLQGGAILLGEYPGVAPWVAPRAEVL